MELQDQIRLLKRRLDQNSNMQQQQFQGLLQQSQEHILAKMRVSEEKLLENLQNQQKDWLNGLQKWVDATMKEKLGNVESRVQKLEEDMVAVQARVTRIEGEQSGQDLLMRTAKEQQKIVCDTVNNMT